MLKSSEAKSVETWKGVIRKVLVLSDNLMLLEVSINKDAMVPSHKHFNEQVGYVVKGKMKLRIGDSWHLLEEGDSYCIPSDVEHEAVALESSTVVEVFHPPVDAFRRDLEALKIGIK
jgi:quercetin dioxygenase-like cupin family protein